ncbi:MAG TPA: response regulator transcription factor [Acidimicrobiales bacterium]|nr:response regulator transcription factor [Acidimicrobiales bacterium]
MTRSLTSAVAVKESAEQIRVAVVDDHSVTAEGLARILGAQSDIEVVGTAGTISEAMALINTEGPNVVLMDYMLPDGNGAEATEQVLERWPTTKVLMLTGSGDPQILSRAFDVGCVGFLSKERPWEEVVTAVRAAAKGEPVIRLDELEGLLLRLKAPEPAAAQWLSARELDVLRRLARAESTSAIAAEMFLSTHTVRNHISNILSKLGAHTRLEAIAIAIRDGIISHAEFG